MFFGGDSIIDKIYQAEALSATKIREIFSKFPLISPNHSKFYNFPALLILLSDRLLIRSRAISAIDKTRDKTADKTTEN